MPVWGMYSFCGCSDVGSDIVSLVAIREFVRATILIPVESVCSSFLVAFEGEQCGVPLHWSVQLASDVEEAAERVGACSILHGCDWVDMCTYGVDEVLHSACTNFSFFTPTAGRLMLHKRCAFRTILFCGKRKVLYLCTKQ